MERESAVQIHFINRIMKFLKMMLIKFNNIENRTTYNCTLWRIVKKSSFLLRASCICAPSRMSR